MNFPIDFYIAGIVIDAHLVFEILAYILGFNYYLYLRKNASDKLTTEQRLWIIVGGALGAAIFSKLLGFLEHPNEILALSEQNVIYLFASKTIVGGLLGGILGVEIAKKLVGIKHSSGDLFCFPIILGMMIGRIGCFLSGVEDATHGLPTDFILGMNLGDGIPRHPTALYEILVLMLIWLSLMAVKKHFILAEGGLFKLFMISYLSWRFGVEFIKPVYRYETIGLSAIQLACLAGLMYYYKSILFPWTLIKTKRWSPNL
jgi:phosphatidylglycerol:prolipoprotein diacylglycerol transferase